LSSSNSPMPPRSSAGTIRQSTRKYYRTGSRTPQPEPFLLRASEPFKSPRNFPSDTSSALPKAVYRPPGLPAGDAARCGRGCHSAVPPRARLRAGSVLRSIASRPKCTKLHLQCFSASAKCSGFVASRCCLCSDISPIRSMSSRTASNGSSICRRRSSAPRS